MSCSFTQHMECVGVKGNYAPPVCFPQPDDGRLFFFFVFPFCLKFNLSSISFVRLQAETIMSQTLVVSKRGRFRLRGSVATYCNNYNRGLEHCDRDF